MAAKEKKPKAPKAPKAPRNPKPRKPGRGLAWGAAWGDLALGAAAFGLVLNCAVLVGSAPTRTASRQRGLKETEKLAQLQDERRKLDGQLLEKTTAADLAAKSVAEKDQAIVAKDAQIAQLQTELAAAKTKGAGKGKGAAKKRR